MSLRKNVAVQVVESFLTFRSSTIYHFKINESNLFSIITEKLVKMDTSSDIELIEDNRNEQNENNKNQVGGEFDKENFIKAVRNFQCLWDTNDKSY